MRIFSSFLLMISIMLISFACTSTKTSNKQNEPVGNTISQAGPPTIIYKTRKDYFDKVPVTLNEKKTRVVNYPGPKDVLINGKPAYPSRLENGFLLDNRGINAGVAFLNMTYEEYAKLESPPSADELMEMVIDNDPLEIMYDCGSRFTYKNLVDDLNDMIREDKLGTWEKLY